MSPHADPNIIASSLSYWNPLSSWASVAELDSVVVDISLGFVKFFGGLLKNDWGCIGELVFETDHVPFDCTVSTDVTVVSLFKLTTTVWLDASPGAFVVVVELTAALLDVLGETCVVVTALPADDETDCVGNAVPIECWTGWLPVAAAAVAVVVVGTAVDVFSIDTFGDIDNETKVDSTAGVWLEVNFIVEGILVELIDTLLLVLRDVGEVIDEFIRSLIVVDISEFVKATLVGVDCIPVVVFVSIGVVIDRTPWNWKETQPSLFEWKSKNSVCKTRILFDEHVKLLINEITECFHLFYAYLRGCSQGIIFDIKQHITN